jgi:diguanylate cyclase (GGDEF)-like protein
MRVASASIVRHFFRSRLRGSLLWIFGPRGSFLACYAAALLASRALGEAGLGGDVPGLAAAAVAGVAIRYGCAFGPIDAIRLGLVRFAFAAVAGEPVADAALGLGLDIASIVAACVMFARMRAVGFISSQFRVASAACAVALAICVVQAAPDAVLLSAGVKNVLLFGATFLAAGVVMALVLILALSYDRPYRAPASNRFEAARRQAEAIAVFAALAAFSLAAVATGRQELALGASVALLWSAMRFGLFPTSLGALLVMSTLVAFGAGEDWSALAGAGPAEAELLRMLALGLLVLPNVMVAAVIHDHQVARRDLAFRAFHDGLTTLANRARFLEVLTGATEAARAKGKRFALFLVDLDHFKAVNDSFGHASGDAMLVEVSRRLRDTVRATDMVARLGGDEFAVVAPVPSADDAARLAARLVKGVDQAFTHNGLELRPTITVGVALAPDSTADAERLMALADQALYEAKAAGRNCWRVCSEDAADAFAADWDLDAAELKPQIVYLD